LTKRKTAEGDVNRFVVSFRGQPVLEVKWLTEAVFDSVRDQVECWLVEARAIERDELAELDSVEARNSYRSKLASCPLHSQTSDQAIDFLRTELPIALQNLIEVLAGAAYLTTAGDPAERCLLPGHRQIHLNEDRYALRELQIMVKEDLKQRIRARGRGGKPRIIKAPEKILTLTREYRQLQNTKTYGDTRDKTLWEIICHRYESGDTKWRERAKLDHKDVPDAVLDLVSQRRKLKLKQSHLALYHAASIAGIPFEIVANGRNGKPFTKPSPSTLLRRYIEGAAYMKTGRKRTQKRKRRPVIRAPMPV
jgi:hypothetical protein